MTEWTTIQIEKPTANKLRKAAIDLGEDIRDVGTKAIQKGLAAVRDESLSRRDNTTTP